MEVISECYVTSRFLIARKNVGNAADRVATIYRKSKSQCYPVYNVHKPKSVDSNKIRRKQSNAKIKFRSAVRNRVTPISMLVSVLQPVSGIKIYSSHEFYRNFQMMVGLSVAVPLTFRIGNG